MTSTATIPLWDALGSAIDAGTNPPVTADVIPAQILGSPRFYRGKVKGTPPPGYFLLGLVNLSPGGEYMAPGEAGTVTIHCWAPTPDEAEKLYRWLHGLVHEQPLYVDGFGTATGQLRKTGPISDATGAAWQVTALYDVEPEDG